MDLTMLPPSRSAKFEVLLSKVYRNHHQTGVVYYKKLQLYQKLNDLLKTELQVPCHLFIVGSTFNRTALKESDLDLCLVIYDQYGQVDVHFKQYAVCVRLLNKLRRIIQTKDMCIEDGQDMPMIIGKHPILRFTEKTNNIVVDLNVNQTVTILNSFLVDSFCAIEPRLVILVVIVKCWARRYGINSPFHGSLSSYSLTLMVIHFLQNCSLLPHMNQLEKYLGNNFFHTYHMRFTQDFDLAIDSVKKVTFQFIRPCVHLPFISIGMLFLHFINYYNHPTIFTNIISLQTPGLIHYNRLHHNDPFLMIQEPLEGKNIAYAVSKLSMFDKITCTFRDMLKIILSDEFFLNNQFDYDRI